MKTCVCWFFLCAAVVQVSGEMVLFRTSTDYATTGSVLKGVGNENFTTNVQEIAGLNITIRTDQTNHVLSANSRSFGVNATDSTEDEASRFDAGEKVVFSFSKDVEITYFDLRNFESGESFHFNVSGAPSFVIDHDAQDSTGSDYISTNLFIAANTPVTMRATTSGNVGFEGFEITVREMEVSNPLTLVATNGMLRVQAVIESGTSTNHVVQSCVNLNSNEWSDVSVPFGVSTNWLLEPEAAHGFYRLITK